MMHYAKVDADYLIAIKLLPQKSTFLKLCFASVRTHWRLEEERLKTADKNGKLPAQLASYWWNSILFYHLYQMHEFWCGHLICNVQWFSLYNFPACNMLIKPHI